MPDANFFAGILATAATCLGSLHSADPRNALEAAKILDDNDPVRLTLALWLDKKPYGVSLLLLDGSTLELYEVFELGFAAARLRIGWAEKLYLNPADPEKPLSERMGFRVGSATIRYSFIASIREREPAQAPGELQHTASE